MPYENEWGGVKGMCEGHVLTTFLCWTDWVGLCVHNV